jgi:hypothetical protein
MVYMTVIILVLLSVTPLVLAEDSDEKKVFNLELEKLLNLGSGLLAAILSALTFISYNRSNNKRLLFVAIAFMLFAAKSFLIGVEIFFGEWSWVDHVASISDFAILLIFFMGIIKK